MPVTTLPPIDAPGRALLLLLGPVAWPCTVSVLRDEGVLLELELDKPAAATVGLGVILERGGARALGHILEVCGRRVLLSIEPYHQPDRREYPRFHAAIDVSYVEGNDADADSWMRGRELPGVIRGTGPIEASATGLAFGVAQAQHKNDVMLLSLGLPGRSKPFRSAARVVRCERDETGAVAGLRVAVEFVRPPTALTRALAQLTIEMQEACLLGAS